MNNPRRRSCIVIGAGLAGLSAAHRLTKAGWKVDVLEAQKRLGGRVLSHVFEEGPGLICELGAEWIGDDHPRMKGLCKEFHLDLKPHRFAYSFWSGGARPSRVYRPGQWCFDRKRKPAFDRFKRQFNDYTTRQKKELDQYDWWSKLQQPPLGFTVRDLSRRDLMDSTDSGESIRLSSAYIAATEYCGGNETDEMDFKIDGGNHRLIQKLAAAVESENEIHKPVTARIIDQRRGGVYVEAEGRRGPYSAQFCICTVPAHCLIDIVWDPPLPLKQLDAAKQLQYSRIMKTAVLYAHRFWPQHAKNGFSVFTSRASDFCFDSTFGQPGRRGILCSYAIGEKADDLAAEVDANRVMKWITEDVVSVVRPGTNVRIAPIDIRRHPWQREEWIGGAYAFYRPGQWFTVRPALARRHRRVLFAGEHLSEEWQGFMEGAVETGEAAAGRLIRLVK